MGGAALIVAMVIFIRARACHKEQGMLPLGFFAVILFRVPERVVATLPNMPSSLPARSHRWRYRSLKGTGVHAQR